MEWKESLMISTIDDLVIKPWLGYTKIQFHLSYNDSSRVNDWETVPLFQLDPLFRSFPLVIVQVQPVRITNQTYPW